MKKSITAAVLCALALSFLSACGLKTAADTETQSTAASTGLESVHMDIDVEEQVTSLAEYKGIDLTISGDYTVSEDDVEGSLLEYMTSCGVTVDTMDELTDDMVAEAFEDDDNGIATKSELKEYVRSVLESQQENYKSQDKVTAAEDYMIENSEVTIPDDYFNVRLEEYVESFERDYCEDGQTMEDYCTDAGLDYDSMLETWMDSLTTQIKSEFLFGRIADLEGIEADDDNFSGFIDYIISSGNIDVSTADDVYDYYGLGNKEDGEQSLRQLYRVNQAISFVVENANITEE